MFFFTLVDSGVGKRGGGVLSCYQRDSQETMNLTSDEGDFDL